MTESLLNCRHWHHLIYLFIYAASETEKGPLKKILMIIQGIK